MKLNNYLKTGKTCIYSTIMLIIGFLSLLIIMSRYKVEESFKTQVVIDNNSNQKIYVSNENIYKIHYDSKLILFYNNKYNEYKIEFISKELKNFVINIYPTNSNAEKLIPGSIVNATVIYSYSSIMDIVLDYFK